MARRVGSPNALVMALTAAENSDVDAGDAGDAGDEVGAAEATPVFYLWP
jgi:hypothetical protein